MNEPGLIARRRRPRVEINIVPLIDVLVVLIFFFLVSMQFRNMTLLQLTLPEMTTAGESSEGEFVEISITKEGEIFYNGEEVARDSLATRLGLVAQANAQTPVLLSADEASLLRDTTTVMDLVRQAGLENLRLQTR
ncbi:MAG: ExbD/TolR family protein [Opitutales bacterium]